MLCIALVIYVCLHGANRIHIMRNATSQEQKDWFEEDFFMKGDFSVMKLFVVVPAIIQVMCLSMMGAVMLFNSYLF